MHLCVPDLKYLDDSIFQIILFPDQFKCKSISIDFTCTTLDLKDTSIILECRPAFKGLHSKCYGYITEDDELIATIAGVPARTLIGQRGDDLIYLTREEELAGITAEMKLADPEIQIKDKIAALDNLKIGAKFKTNTGTTSTYIIDKPHMEIINGHKTQLAGGCVINKLAEKKIKDFTIDEIDEIEDYPDEQSEN